METKIDRGFFNICEAYQEMLGHGRSIDESYDEESYNTYIVVKYKDGSDRIETGWDFVEDAKDRKRELKEDGIQSKIVSRKYLKRIGLDPSDDSNWVTGNFVDSVVRNDS